MFFSELKHEITMLVIRTLFLSQILVSLKPTKTPQRKKISQEEEAAQERSLPRKLELAFRNENFDVKKVTQRKFA